MIASKELTKHSFIAISRTLLSSQFGGSDALGAAVKDLYNRIFLFSASNRLSLLSRSAMRVAVRSEVGEGI